MAETIGWLATALFLTSYSCSDQRKLRLTQAGAALLWVGYGVLLHALPIVVANLLVAGVAIYSSRRDRARQRISPAREPDLSGIS